ncbi:putative protein kinase CAMK-CDPK family [Helianthus annuus]|nr:putative protein kinase CAMK-CDPK family [Helianthus annuus]KAJ0776701.1 putative protein kinase CAMK-CDPK family [Helianthus annuus]
MHRDLKPENFLLSTEDENAMLKATDFGLSVFIEGINFVIVREQWRICPQIASVGTCYLVGVICNGLIYVANAGDLRVALGRADSGEVFRLYSYQHGTF